MDQPFDIARLIYRNIKQKLSPDEQQQLDQWLAASEANRALYEKLTSSRHLVSQTEVYQQFDKARAWKELEAQLFEAKTVSMTSRSFLRYAASIILPLLISVGVIYYFVSKPGGSDMTAIDQTFKPGTQKATLILADGAEVKLEDNPQTTKVLKQGKATITNKQQALEYASPNVVTDSDPVIYNELRTPPGGRYQLKLADGTEVTLNAASTLKYPVAFTDSTRTVYLTGEAFFVVSHTGKPFIVASEEQQIRVLGTTFNVSAYLDEPVAKTTLVEGKVRVVAERNSTVLQPGEQAVLDRSAETLAVATVDPSSYTAWVKGKFEFTNDNLETVMKRLARWYGFEYVFENQEAKNYHFTGRIDDNQSISSILEMLTLTTDVSFDLEGETIIIH